MKLIVSQMIHPHYTISDVLKRHIKCSLYATLSANAQQPCYNPCRTKQIVYSPKYMYNVFIYDGVSIDNEKLNLSWLPCKWSFQAVKAL